MRLEDLIAPVSASQFLGDYWGRRPVHISADKERNKAALLDWARFNDMLAMRSHWNRANIKLIMDSRPVDPDFYLDEVDFGEGPAILADPAKVNLFLSMGASLVANNVEHIAPHLKAVTSALGDRFSARSGANVYCSFGGVQAFASHCDLHEVFVVQCEGEKRWNIYQNRAMSPTETINGPDAQNVIDSAKGQILQQVTLRPGDVLYIPRGFYHDALATDGASLHVTFSVLPLVARGIFPLLEQLALEDEAFRQYLPDPREREGDALEEALSALAERLVDIVRSRRFALAVADRQRALWDPVHDTRLPERQALNFYARSQAPAQVRSEPSGPTLVTRRGTVALDKLARAAEWLLGRPAFSLEELAAQFRHIPAEDLSGLVRQLIRLDLIFPYTPGR